VAVTFSLAALALFILQTVFLAGTPGLKNIDLFIILAVYLGFTHTPVRAVIPVMFMGLLAYTFSGGPGSAFIIVYGLIYLLCLTMGRKTNLDLLLYRVVLVFACSLGAGILLLGNMFVSKVWLPFEWSTLLIPALSTAVISPAMCRVFRLVDEWRQHMIGRVTSKIMFQKVDGRT
jgi:hypothetical protein